jgi:hypothetical protein
MRLEELAKADRRTLSIYIHMALEDHCKAMSAKIPVCEGLPSPEQLEKHRDFLEYTYNTLKPHLNANDGTRTRTKYNMWVASIAGENEARRTEEQWQAFHKAAVEGAHDINNLAFQINAR